MNYYFILGIDCDASDAEIKDAYRKLALKYHPDHFGEDSSPFLKIQEAYQVLSNPQLKRKYDQSLIRQKPQLRVDRNTRSGRYSQEPEPLIPENRSVEPEPISFSQSFETYFPSLDEIFDRYLSNYGQDFRQKSERTKELKVEVSISSHQAASGGSVRFLIPVRIPCPLCQGTGFAGLWECHRCFSLGFIDTELPLLVYYPAGIKNTFNKSLSLRQFGIHNYYLTVSFRVDRGIEES
jgi:DnaJ-class molecular chaperone